MYICHFLILQAWSNVVRIGNAATDVIGLTPTECIWLIPGTVYDYYADDFEENTLALS